MVFFGGGGISLNMAIKHEKISSRQLIDPSSSFLHDDDVNTPPEPIAWNILFNTQTFITHEL